MTIIQHKRGTSERWVELNPVLAESEIGYDTILKKAKIGDGVTAWTDLPFIADGGSAIDAYTKAETDSLLAEKNNKIFDINKFTVVGNPTITDDGVASGLINGNEIKTGYILSFNNNFEIIAKFNLNTVNGFYIYLGNTLFGADGFKQHSWLSSSSLNDIGQINGNTTILQNIDYYFKFGYENGSYYQKLSTDGINYVNENSLSSNVHINSSEVILGTWGGGGGGLVGSIDLKQFSITVDGKEVFNGLMDSTKPIYDAIATNKTTLNDFKTDTSNNFSAVNSALNEKANLSDLSLKQNMLVSGTNIKTINGNSILGEGNLVVSGGGEGGASIDDSTTSSTTTWSSEKVNTLITQLTDRIAALEAEINGGNA